MKILIIGKIRGKITANLYRTLRANRDRVPENALFQYAFAKFSDRNMGKVFEVMENERYFPSDRLPTTADRCTDYLWQRESSTDWNACNDRDVKEHPGLDYLFMYGLLKNG